MTVPSAPVDAVLLNGTVGSGKTTTARALSDQESASGGRHAVIDLDEVRLLFPPPEGDPFQHEVELANLRDLARNYRSAGATRLVLAGVVQNAAEVGRYREALAGARLLVCRLTVGPDLAEQRLRRRHRGAPKALRWHLHRTVELAALLDAAAFEDLRLDTGRRSPRDVAREIRRAAGWAG